MEISLYKHVFRVITGELLGIYRKKRGKQQNDLKSGCSLHMKRLGKKEEIEFPTSMKKVG